MNTSGFTLWRRLRLRGRNWGIISIRREFMIADEDNSKTIDINEFNNFSHDYRIALEENEIQTLFIELDLNINW